MIESGPVAKMFQAMIDAGHISPVEAMEDLRFPGELAHVPSYVTYGTPEVFLVKLEDDQKLQDIVLIAHHCYVYTLANTPAFKTTENHIGRAVVRIPQQTLQIV